jgi:hypothetical protein
MEIGSATLNRSPALIWYGQQPPSPGLRRLTLILVPAKYAGQVHARRIIHARQQLVGLGKADPADLG